MKIFSHRCNSLEQLQTVDQRFGIEVDIRSFRHELVLSHDPFQDSFRLSELLDNYRHSGIILNVKEEGLEETILQQLNSSGISEFFFLDQSFPLIMRTIRLGLAKHVAVRVSDVESLETLKNLNCVPGYVWCDSFSGDWSFMRNLLSYCEAHECKAVLASPELHPHNSLNQTIALQELDLEFRSLHGVCTKFPNIWLDV